MKGNDKMPQGTLIAQVYTSMAQLPIENAYITVTDTNEENPSIIASRKTNSSGKTSIITLDTPPRSDSLTPNPDDIPFVSYNIRIDHPEFESIVIKNVQIFEGLETIQEAMLIPLAELSKGNRNTETVTITPQPL